ncbi:hypothetical protein E2C01_020092 [Portunus trituberculatus]|uniref:Uncharacterized protein n=1 Tax=Portunus trituberculatus TaxID=210409 RepID=A0A5B7DZ99_PORTR|nr:hypothetical protein [Portunus trituberculatus]
MFNSSVRLEDQFADSESYLPLNSKMRLHFESFKQRTGSSWLFKSRGPKGITHSLSRRIGMIVVSFCRGLRLEMARGTAPTHSSLCLAHETPGLDGGWLRGGSMWRTGPRRATSRCHDSTQDLASVDPWRRRSASTQGTLKGRQARKKSRESNSSDAVRQPRPGWPWLTLRVVPDRIHNTYKLTPAKTLMVCTRITQTSQPQDPSPAGGGGPAARTLTSHHYRIFNISTLTARISSSPGESPNISYW